MENADQKLTVEILKEELKVDKRTVETGTVRFIKKVHETEETIQVDLASTNVTVEKIAINQIVDTAPAIRYEGEVMIVPVLKEVLVTEKKLMLVEEWHISQAVTTREHKENIPLREEELIVERIPKT